MDAADESLVENFRKLRNPHTFKQLVQRYQSQLYSIAYRMVGNHEEAEEIVQETFLRVYTGINQLHRSSSFYAWLLSIIHNLCRDLLRVKQRRLALHGFSLDQNRGGGERVVAETSGWNVDPAYRLEELEQSVVIERLLAKLPDHQRAVVVLHDIEGLPYQQIATVTGTSLGTVRSRLHYARLKLRMLLEPYLCGRTLVRGLITTIVTRSAPVTVSRR